MQRKEFLKKTGLAILSMSGLPVIANHTKENRIFQLDKSQRSSFCIDKDIIFLNNGTTGPSPKIVEEAVISRIKQTNRKASYGGGNKGLKISLAKYLNVHVDELGLTQNVTHGINIAVNGLVLKPTDEIILTSHEHVGNSSPWLTRQFKDGYKIKVVDPADTAEEMLERVKKACNSATKVIALPHIPCTIGQVFPIKEICKWARTKNIITVIDGAHGPGMLDIDLADMDPDIYLSCLHKWLLGPKGVGFIYVKSDFLKNVNITFSGYHHLKNWVVNTEEVSIEQQFKNPAIFEYGTHNSSLYYGAKAAVDFHLSLGKKNVANYVKATNDYAYNGLSQFGSKVNILTPKESISRAGIVSFKLQNGREKELYNEARRNKIILRFVAESDLDCIRVSTHIYNSKKDIDSLLKFMEAYV